jgi:hypothetical protein
VFPVLHGLVQNPSGESWEGSFQALFIQVTGLERSRPLGNALGGGDAGVMKLDAAVDASA